jgi:copper chaperone CopZ
MLSVFSVDDVEKRIGEVPGVESVTVNYAAGSATVRYDETRLEIADIKSAVRQSGYEAADAPAVSAVAPLLFRVSHWWLALSLLMLGIAVSAVMALRQP